MNTRTPSDIGGRHRFCIFFDYSSGTGFGPHRTGTTKVRKLFENSIFFFRGREKISVKYFENTEEIRNFVEWGYSPL